MNEDVPAFKNDVAYYTEGALMPWAGPESGWYILNGPEDDPDSCNIQGPFKTMEDAFNFIDQKAE